MGASDALFELGMLYATGRDVADATLWSPTNGSILRRRGAIRPPSPIVSSLRERCRPTRSPRRKSSPANGCKHTKARSELLSRAAVGRVCRCNCGIDCGSQR